MSLCLSLFAEASEYIFTYRVTVKNGIVLGEKYYFSPSMLSGNLSQKTKNPSKKCEISHEAKTEKDFINRYKEKILECFFNWGIRLEDRSETQNLRGRSVTLLSIPPTRIEVEYANGLTTIYAMMRKKK